MYICLFYLAHPIVFGDDRVLGMREQMMFQVDPVRHRDGAGARLGINIFIRDFLFYDFE